MVLVVEHRSVHVEVPDCPALRLSSSFSVSTWVCLDTLSDVPGYQKEGGWPCILCKTRSWDNGFGFYGLPDGRVRFYVNEWDQFFVETPPIKLGRWVCLTATFEFEGDNGTLCVYMDGKLQQTKGGFPPMRRNDAPLCLGATMWGENGWYAIDGSMGPTLVWNRRLKASESADVARGRAPSNGLVLRLDLSESAGETALDTSPKSNPDHGVYMESITRIDRGKLPQAKGAAKTSQPWGGVVSGGSGGAGKAALWIGTAAAVAAVCVFMYARRRQ